MLLLSLFYIIFGGKEQDIMDKRHFFIAAMCLMTLAGCTQKTELPENPKDQEEYRDSQGNSWIYNAMLMRWALMPSPMNGLAGTHYYYPRSGEWTDARGTKVDPPSKIKVARPSSAKSGGNVFGTTRRSSGIHA